jgi:peptide/nickel transport system substrate-binding protein
LRKRTFDLAEYGVVGSIDNGIDFIISYSTKWIPTAENNYASGNFPGYSNTVADSLIARQAAILGVDERRGILAALQLIVADDLPTLPLFFRPNVSAASDRLVNFRPEYASTGYTWNAWEWDLQ